MYLPIKINYMYHASILLALYWWKDWSCWMSVCPPSHWSKQTIQPLHVCWGMATHAYTAFMRIPVEEEIHCILLGFGWVDHSVLLSLYEHPPDVISNLQAVYNYHVPSHKFRTCKLNWNSLCLFLVCICHVHLSKRVNESFCPKSKQHSCTLALAQNRCKLS
jgi:hypothetical protein